MRAICLGGAGRICREAALELAMGGGFERLTIADLHADAAREAAAWLEGHAERSPACRIDWALADVRDPEAAADVLRGADVVLDGTTISLNDASTAAIARAGCSGVNLNGFGEENKYDAAFRANGKTLVPGFGMTPGVTNLLAKAACDAMERVDAVRVSHGAFRPVAFSASILETTTYEYDPALPGRVVFEDGGFVQVPPFARPREIALPEPYGRHVQYIIPHSETVTLAEYLRDKGVGLIEVRGTWPPENMALVRALYDFGFLRNDPVQVAGARFGVLEAVAAHLQACPEGRTTRLYGYALHVEVEGVRDGRRVRHTLTHTHPASDGSAPEWEGLRAYTRNVGIPLAVGATLIALGRAAGTGVLSPERAFEPRDVFERLALRGILVHESLADLGEP